MSNTFNFYRRAYQVNQGYGSNILSLSNIDMKNLSEGDTTNNIGIVDTWYADTNSNSHNISLFSTYSSGKFQNTTPGSDHRASYLSDTNSGPATPKINSYYTEYHDGTTYPMALGDYYTYTPYGNYGDWGYAIAGWDPNIGSYGVDIYQISTSTYQTSYITGYNATACPFPPTGNNIDCRIFTSPDYTDQKTGLTGGGSGQVKIITLVAWDYGTNQTYFENFRFSLLFF